MTKKEYCGSHMMDSYETLDLFRNIETLQSLGVDISKEGRAKIRVCLRTDDGNILRLVNSAIGRSLDEGKLKEE